MTSIARSQQPPSTAKLIEQILDRPELVAAVRGLPSPVLSGLIDRVGLEDAGDLVALASDEQLRDLFDQDLWRAAAPGEDERFRPERFALWLEILFEGGEDFLIERLCAMPNGLLTFAVHRLALVVDIDRLWEGVIGPGEAVERLERALDAPLHEDWEEFRLLARDPAHWDVLWSALLALDRDHHDVLRAILEQCCVLSAESVANYDGEWVELLTSEEMLAGDVAGEREDRRTEQGFVAASDARSFLALARSEDSLGPRDPITKAYFRNREAEEPARVAETVTIGPGTRSLAGNRSQHDLPGTQGHGDATTDVDRLVRLIETAAEGVYARDASTPAIGSGTKGDGSSESDVRKGRSRNARSESSSMPLQMAMAALRERNPPAFSRRIEELHYLANVLIAGRGGRRLRPVEALEEAMAICNRGLERAVCIDASFEPAVELLENTNADQLFRLAYGD